MFVVYSVIQNFLYTYFNLMHMEYGVLCLSQEVNETNPKVLDVLAMPNLTENKSSRVAVKK